MRPFPRTPSRRRTAAVLLAATLSLVVALPLAHAEDLKQKQADAQRDQQQAQAHVKHAEHDLHESSNRLRKAIERVEAARSALRSARSELHDARADLRQARARDREMQRRLDVAEARLEQAREDVVAGRAAVAAQSLAVEDMVNAFYQQGDPQLLSLTALLNSETPADLTREAEARNVIVSEETRAYDQLEAAEVLLKVREQQVEDATAAVAEARERAAEHLAETKVLETRAQEARDRVRARVDEAARARKQAQAARAKDRAVLRRAMARERQIQARIRQIAQQLAQQAAQQHQPSNPDGLLARPVNGPVTSPFGYRTHPIYGYYSLHNGTDFGASCGAPLYASNGGRVMSRYYSSVWGNRLFLNLGIVGGRSVVVVYNHLSSYAVGPGETVGRGQLVGRVGTTGWSTGCHLHFTVMANGRAVDPMNWF